MSKEKPKSSKTGALVMVLLVLWLAGLTALVLMYLKKPAENELENRVVKLETKANTLVGKVKPPGSEELNSLMDRVDALEKRVAGLGSGDVAPVGASGVDGSCDCDQLQGRLAALESAVDSESGTRTVGGARTGKKATGEKKTPPAETATRTEAGSQADTSEKSMASSKKTSAKSRSKSTDRRTPPPYRPGAAPAAPSKVANDGYSGSNQDYGSRTVHDINRRYEPIYEGSSDDASSRGLLGPGGGGFR